MPLLIFFLKKIEKKMKLILKLNVNTIRLNKDR